MLPLRNESQPVVAVEPVAAENPLEWLAGLGIDHQEFVLVELYFQGLLRMHHGDPGAAVIEEEILVVLKHAFQHQPFHSLTAELANAAAVLMGGFEDDV